jgi:hypothetical protein
MDEPIEFVETDREWLAAEQRVIELAGKPIEDLGDDDVAALKPHLTETEWGSISERRANLGFERAFGRELSPGTRDLLGHEPSALHDLSDAAESLGLLASCAGQWMSEQEWRALARELRPLLQAAAALFETRALRSAAELAALPDQDTAFVVATSLAGLRVALTPCAPELQTSANRGEEVQL